MDQSIIKSEIERIRDMRNPQKAATVQCLRVTLAQCVTLYEDHFKIDMPGKLPYKHAAQMVLREVGEAEFLARFNALDLDGSYKKQFTVYKDLEDAGESFTIYDNDLGSCIAQILGDDPDLEKYLASGRLVDGLDNRSEEAKHEAL